MLKGLRLALATCALTAASAVPASAELVFLTSGRTLSVRGHRVEGESLVLMLRAGGEMTCDRALVARIEPDEVPYPEPEPATQAQPDQSAGLLAVVPYGELIDNLSSAHGVDPVLVRAVIQVESAYAADARSHKGARGLMQVMPATGRQYGAQNLYDPRTNLDAGIRHLKSLLQKYERSVALAAYNAGEGAVKRFGGIPPYRETRSYVAKILSLLKR
jgi:soluble lytic murein transglycosylase-like protein